MPSGDGLPTREKGSNVFALVSLGVSLVLYCFATPLRPELPIVYFASCLFAIISLATCRSSMVRLVAMFMLIVGLTTSVFRFNDYVRFQNRARTLEYDTLILQSLYAKMVDYCQKHPNDSPTNLSDCVRDMVLTSNETRFLTESKVVVYPYTGMHGKPLFRVEKDSTIAIVYQDGVITWRIVGKLSP